MASTVELLAQLDRNDYTQPSMTEEEKDLIKKGYYPDDGSKIFTLAVLRASTIPEIRAVIKWYIDNATYSFSDISKIFARDRSKSIFAVFYRDVIVRNIGFAVPSEEALQKLSDWMTRILHHYPNIHFVNVGAGSGVWEYLLQDMGISGESLVAIDVPDTEKTHRFAKRFYNITEVNKGEYQTPIEDVLIIMWGYGMTNIVTDYVNRGGWCVILLGESYEAATHPSGDEFTHGSLNDRNWVTQSISVVGGAGSCCRDILSLNIRPDRSNILTDQDALLFYSSE